MKSLLILYGSFTGNTQMVAEAVQPVLAEAFPALRIDLKNVRDTSPEGLAGYDAVIFGASTWDHGQADADTDEFLANLAAAAPNLSGKIFALFGLGDSSYPDFCDAIRLMKETLEPLHATIYPDSFTIDGYPEDQAIAGLTEWAKKFINTKA
jgi:flavodoxin I